MRHEEESWKSHRSFPFFICAENTRIEMLNNFGIHLYQIVYTSLRYPYKGQISPLRWGYAGEKKGEEHKHIDTEKLHCHECSQSHSKPSARIEASKGIASKVKPLL